MFTESVTNSFNTIDLAIDSFIKNEAKEKRIKVSNKPKSDWLIYEWRQLTWEENGIKYLIEVYPNFDKQEQISSWTLYCAASYDHEGKRYYLKHSFASEKDLGFIFTNINDLLSKSFNYIVHIAKEEISFAVDLD